LLSLSLCGLPAVLAKKRAGDRSPGPSRLAACVGAQVALQRCPILRTGAINITFNRLLGNRKLLVGKEDQFINQGGVNFALSQGVIFQLSLAFWQDLMDMRTEALDTYQLSPQARSAILRGDLHWIIDNVGELTQKQLLFIFQRQENEVLIP
jgi:hypothetical protein